MKKFRNWAVSGLALAITISSAPSARAENTRVTNPSAVGIEILGRGLLYSVQFDRVLSEDMAAGIGFGTVSTEIAGFSANTAHLVPVYFNYYFMREQGSIFATGGVTVALNSGSVGNLSTSISGVDLPDSPVVPNVGLGYENRSEAGFLFRVAAYALVGKKLAPWGGFTFGYSF